MNSAFEQALALHRGGQLDAATQGYQAILATDAQHFGALVHLGAVRLAQGRAAEAETLLRRAVAQAGDSAPAHGSLAAALQAQARIPEAVAAYRQAIALDPGLWDAHYGLATALQLLGRHEEAIESLQTILRAFPEHAEAHYSLALLLQALARHDQAQQHFRAALAIDPDFAEASHGLGSLLLRGGQPEAAIDCLNQALDVDAGYVDARHALATALRVLERDDLAIDAYQAVLAAEPEHPLSLHGLATIRSKQQRFNEARQLFERATARQPTLAEAWCGLAEQQAHFGEFELAEASFRCALALRRDFPQALAGLGRLLLEQGDLTAARVHLAAAMALEPANTLVLFLLAQAGKVTASDPVFSHAEALLPEESRQSPAARECLHFALAKACDDLGERDQGFDHLLIGNAVRRQRVNYNEAATLGFLDQVARSFSAGRISAFQGAGDPARSPVFVVGMPRSGSTLIEQILASHPDVHGAGENLVFASIVDTLSARYGNPAAALNGPDAKAYLREMGSCYVDSMRSLAPNATRIVDKSLGNFRFVGLIHMALPNARFIHAVRDPVDTCLSCFAQLFGEGTQDFSFDLAELGRFHRAQAALMQHWRHVLPPGVMLELNYESLVRSLEPEARRIVQHCGLDWSEACLRFHQTQRSVRTASVVQVRQPIYQTSVGRWRPAEAQLRPLLDALAGR